MACFVQPPPNTVARTSGTTGVVFPRLTQKRGQNCLSRENSAARPGPIGFDDCMAIYAKNRRQTANNCSEAATRGVAALDELRRKRSARLRSGNFFR
jgi:hypothetical protein